ncbi:TIGR03943 family protein [Streptosporangium sp. NPDC051022]|uniref:TIGR03943 family putative permease subunit n=1 Tax=Streptosporangium sp. NPDC051022 TaxID=3155752 RepID=UPI0034402714
MNRVTQNLILTLLGCAVLRISAFSTTYLNYVKPGFRPFLIAAGVVLVLLGVTGLLPSRVLRMLRMLRISSASRASRAGETASGGVHHRPDDHRGSGSPSRPGPEDHSPEEHGQRDHVQGKHGHGSHGYGDHGHDHSSGPRVAWLMCLPVFAIFLIAPPALGSFAAARSDTPPPRDLAASSFAPLAGDGPVDMPISEFVGRAWDDDNRSLTGRQVRLTGFAVPSKRKGQWYVTRMQIACCAADAFPLKVAVRGLQAPPEDTWVEVTGTWIPHTFGRMPNGVVYPELAGTDLVRIGAPAEPYE